MGLTKKTPKHYSHPDLKEKFKDVKYVVEATYDETHLLWDKYHKEDDWQQETIGTLPTIGEFSGYPVTVSIFFYKINGHRVAFYEAASLVVHYDMVKDWVRDHFPPNTPTTNTANFGHCLWECRKKV